MSSIMRGDQTVTLIQLYHAHYPEIARNTQDSEGRNQRVNMWKKIAEELNLQFNTNFTVEQFKKKVQNVQCTSRQKVQNNKRNLGDAEMEYMRLFETERLKTMDVLPSKFSTYVDGLTNRSRSVSQASLSHNNNNSVNIDDFTLSAKCKLEQIMDDYGIENGVNNFENEKHLDDDTQGAEGDEDDIRSRSTPGTSGSGGSTGNNGNILSNNSNLNGSSSFDQAQQLLLAMMASASGNLSVNNSVNTNNTSGKNISDTLLATINAARRKRTANLATNTNINNNNFSNNNLNNNINNENVNFNANVSEIPKRRRKQAHALHLSHLRPTEPFLPLESPVGLNTSTLNNDGLLGIGTNTVSVTDSDKVSQGNANWSLTFGNSSSPVVDVSGENKWRNDVSGMQKSIIENQRRILDIIERQALYQQEKRELRRQRFNSQSPPSPPLNARQQRPNLCQIQNDSVLTFNGIDDSGLTATTTNNNHSETILVNLCDKISKLSDVLCCIDETIKTYLPRRDLNQDTNNSINVSKKNQTCEKVINDVASKILTVLSDNVIENLEDSISSTKRDVLNATIEANGDTLEKSNFNSEDCDKNIILIS